MPPEFIQRHTRFITLEDFLEAGSIVEKEQLETSEWDAFVQTETRFETWADMMETAVGEWAEKIIMS